MDATASLGKRLTLRRRLNRVLLQAFVLLVSAASVVLAISFASARHHTTDDRLLLARTIAHYFDATISTALQDLGRLAAELPAIDAGAVGRLRAFRFQSAFREATYVLDERGRLLVADPADTAPLPVSQLVPHEAVTTVVRKPAGPPHPIVAIVRPFRRDGAVYYVVSEMNPVGSPVSGFLRDLGMDPETNVTVVDANGVVVAAADERHLLRTVPQAETYGERITSHRPFLTEDLACDTASGCPGPGDVLTVMVPLTFAPWAVVVRQQKTAAFSALYTTQRGLVIAGLVIAATAVLLSRALSRSIVSPIQALSRQAAALRAGDLASPITVTGDAEIEVLGRTLDEARQRLASTLGELRALNEDLERQVASRTRLIEARYLDLKLLHAVAQVSTQEREPASIVPRVLALIAQHYGFTAAALVTRPTDEAPTRYVVPDGAVVPAAACAGAAPPGWCRRELRDGGRLQAELFHPSVEHLDERVMEALEHQLAVSLDAAYLWKRTLAQDEQRRLLLRRLLNAAEEERRRLARGLHDEIAQLLTAIQFSLAHVPLDTAEMAKARSLVGQTQQEIHRIIYDLRPSLLDDLGLPAAVKAYAEEHLLRQGLSVNLEVQLDLPPRPEIDITAFRIYQELVTNVLRHARAESVSVELYEHDGTLVLAVEDDGVGFDPEQKGDGVGIVGMRERAALVNGSIRFDSERGMGTHVVVEIPVR